jgi:hypothetical protein
MAGTGSDRDGRGHQGARRARQQQPGRPHRVQFSLTEQELAVVEEAARRAGLAKGAYAAQVVLAAGHGSCGSATARWRSALAR